MTFYNPSYAIYCPASRYDASDFMSTSLNLIVLLKTIYESVEKGDNFSVDTYGDCIQTFTLV